MDRAQQPTTTIVRWGERNYWGEMFEALAARYKDAVSSKNQCGQLHDNQMMAELIPLPLVFAGSRHRYTSYAEGFVNE